MDENKGLFSGVVYLIVRSGNGEIINHLRTRDIGYFSTLDLAKEKVLEEGLKIVREIINEAKTLSSFHWKKSKSILESVWTHEKEMTHLLLRVRKQNKGKHKGKYYVGIFYTGLDGSLDCLISPTFTSAKRDADKLALATVEKIAKEAGLKNY